MHRAAGLAVVLLELAMRAAESLALVISLSTLGRLRQGYGAQQKACDENSANHLLLLII
jgi:hypothetical protein